MADDEANLNTIPEADRKLREDLTDYTTSEAADPWIRELRSNVEAHWEQWNATHFGERLVTPLVIFAQPRKPQAYGEYRVTSVHGSKGEVAIRPTIPEGRHPLWECNNPKRPMHLPPAPEPTEEQRMRFAIDVALHETVHQWQHEIHGTKALGHNALFRDKCNEIGREFGLGPVRAKLRKDSPDAHLPFCGQWPHCVRPEGYYGHLREDHETPRRTREDYRLDIASLLYGYAIGTGMLPDVPGADAALRWLAGEASDRALDLMDSALVEAENASSTQAALPQAAAE